MNRATEVVLDAIRSCGADERAIDAFLKTMEEPRPRQLHERDFSGPCYVYCLFDPPKRRPFYVGISKYPFYRFEQHRRDQCSAAWPTLNRLLNEGYEAGRIYKIYKKCSDRNAALELEYKLITTTPGLVNKERRRFRMNVPI